MTDFHEVRFPVKISYGSTGGPSRRVDIVTLANGFEERNSPWAYSRHKYNVGYGIKQLTEAYQVVEFFQAREAQLYGFRYKDWADYKSCNSSELVAATDQVIGTGDGVTEAFQLVKTYSDIGNSYIRAVTKPIASSVIIAFDGIIQDITTFYVDPYSGIVLFASAPPSGVRITAGYEYDVPVRFDTDWLPINLSNYEAGEFADIPLIEVRIDPVLNPNLTEDGQQFMLDNYSASATIRYASRLRETVEEILVEIDP